MTTVNFGYHLDERLLGLASAISSTCSYCLLSFLAFGENGAEIGDRMGYRMTPTSPQIDPA